MKVPLLTAFSTSGGVMPKASPYGAIETFFQTSLYFNCDGIGPVSGRAKKSLGTPHFSGTRHSQRVSPVKAKVTCSFVENAKHC